MKRSRLKNIINKSKELSNKTIGESSFDKFKKSLPIEVDDNYRLESAWKAYGKPKDYKEALWQGLIQPIDEDNIKLPSIGYNEETDEYEYLNKGRENETVAKDIRVWDNDVIPLVKELKQGGFIRIYDDEKDCWVYKKGGKIKVLMADGSGTIEIDTPDSDLKAGRKPIGKKNGKNLYLNGDGKAVYAENTKENPELTRWLLMGGKSKLKERKLLLGTENPEIVVNNVALEKLKQKEELQQKILQDQADFNGSLIDETDAENERFNFEMSDAYDWHNYLKYIDFLRTHNIEPGDYIHWAEQNRSSKRISPKDYLESKGQTFIFKQGGQILQNIIPEGSLHARKNGMELAKKGEITPKGIPVVDNDGQQQAEIEKEEWTMTKELTDDVEKWYHKYYDKETSEKDKDELAIKCGKRITEELLHNTDDRANLITKMLEEEE